MPYTPTPVLLTLSWQIIQAITEAQIILATKPGATAGNLAILWKGNAPEELAAKLKPLLEGIIRGTMTDANVLEDVVAMLAVGSNAGDPPATILSRALGAAMLVGFGIHPTYGDALQMAMAHTGDLLNEAQRKTMEDLEHRGYLRRPLMRYGVMAKPADGDHPEIVVHVHPDGTFAA